MPIRVNPPSSTLRRLAMSGLLPSAISCFGAEQQFGPSACATTSRYPQATGCAVVTGKVTDVRDAVLPGIDGVVRLFDACVCSSPRLEGDDNGVFTTVVHRLPRPAGLIDTASATVVVLASDARYPRHSTGAAYFDTVRVLLRFAPIGQTPPAIDVRLRIPLP